MVRYVLLLAIAVWAAPRIPLDDRTTAPDASSLAARPPTALNPTPELRGKLPTIVLDPFATVAEMHRWHTKQFIDQSGFGFVRIAPIADSHRSRLQIDGSPFHLKQRRLIGAWRHREPRLYEPHILALGHEASSVPWTALDETDTRALKSFRDGADIFVGDDHSRALGALRATNACVKCHDVARGTVLGALRYDLVPETFLTKYRIASFDSAASRASGGG